MKIYTWSKTKQSVKISFETKQFKKYRAKFYKM